MNIKKIDVLKNFILNLTASVLPIFVLQVIVYPFMSRQLDSNNYGLMITFYSLLMFIVNSSSIAVSDLRLLYDKDYRDKHLEGDFSVLMRKYLLLSIVTMLVMSFFFYGHMNFVNFILIIMTTIAVFVNSYMHIEFIMRLRYKRVCINSFFMSGGYLIGVALYHVSGYWEFTYLMAYGISSVYIFFNTNIIKEKNLKTKNYKRMRRESALLFSSSIIANSTSYADRIVLFPIIGGRNVSIYYTASFLGKIISIGINPVNRLILGYITDMDRISNKLFLKLITVITGLSIIGYFVCLVLTKPIIAFLYPQWLDEVLFYAPVTTATAIMSSMASMIQPFLLRYTPVKWQTFIQASGAMLYFTIALALFVKLNLMGFCIGGAIGSMYKVICMVLIYCKCRREELK